MSTNKSDPRSNPHSHRSLIKSTSILSVGTLTSRILGFVRDVILAKFFGTGHTADAFFVAFRIPNLFREIVGEGAANSAVVPIISEYKEKKTREELWEFISIIFVLALMTLSVITILGVILAPWVVRVIAPGFVEDPGKLELTIRLTQILFPYLILIGLTAYCMAILYTFRSFAVPAFAPCLLNIAFIVSAWLASRSMAEPVYGLAIGVLVGGLLQLIVHLRPLQKLGVKFVKPMTLNHEGAHRVRKLLLPRMFGAGVYELNVFVNTFCASLSSIVGLGGISAIYYSNRLIQFPMGIFSIALAAAALPTFSQLAASNNLEQLRKTLIFSLETTLFFIFPISMMFMILAEPIIRILFERGEFDFYSTRITAEAMFYYSIGLFSFSAIKILVTAFHSLQDTRTPAKIAALCLLANVFLNVLLMWPLKVGGIALASSLAGILNFGILLFILDKKLNDLKRSIFSYGVKILFLTVLSGCVVSLAWQKIPISFEIGKIILVGGLGSATYLLLCYWFNVSHVHKVLGWLKERK